MGPEGVQNFTWRHSSVFNISRGGSRRSSELRAVNPKRLRDYAGRPPRIFRIARCAPRWLSELCAMPPENIEDYVRRAPRAFRMVPISKMYHELTKALVKWSPFSDRRVGRKTVRGLEGPKVNFKRNRFHCFVSSSRDVCSCGPESGPPGGH